MWRIWLVASSIAACTENPVGRICDLGSGTPQTNEISIASPSLDCVSRTCLHQPLQRALPPGSTFPTGNTGLCTAECTSDSDCDRVPESPCVTGFACTTPMTTGDYCCRKLCVCKDYIVLPAVRHDDPACNAADPGNGCCNLDGRRGNASYPHCQ